jgi:hypothetical protein
MARREPKRSTQSAALNRPARKRYSDAEQPSKSARPPRQAEGRHSKPDVPGEGRLAVRGGVLPMPRGSGRH